MIMKFLLPLIFLIILASCNSGNTDSSSTISTDSIVHSEQAVKPAAKDTSDFLSVDGDTLQRQLTLENKDARVETPVLIKNGDSLFVSLTSGDPKANIRITQIEFPDGTFDGPFGRDVKYQINQHGKYVIISGPNMMAGDPCSGVYQLKAWVK